MEDTLTTVIEDSITDATLPVDPISDSASSDDLSFSPTPEVAPEPTVAPTEASQAQTPNPAAPKVDDFDKRYGLAQNSPTGKENRIPYSRVKKIADNAVKDAKTSWQKDLETGYVPAAKFQELNTQVKSYQTQIADYERTLVSEPERFLQTLSQMPQYAAIFERLFAQAAQPAAPEAPVTDDMPQPDQPLSDGSYVYSMEGVKALNAWNRAQAKKETMAEVETRIKAIESRYSGMEKDYNQHQTIQTILPKVEAQIADARTWPLFNESEAEIVKVLADNPKASLERAYQLVVFPKLQANRDQMRASILNEVRQAPRATSAPSSATRSNPTPSGPRSLEQVIADSIKGLR